MSKWENRGAGFIWQEPPRAVKKETTGVLEFFKGYWPMEVDKSKGRV